MHVIARFRFELITPSLFVTLKELASHTGARFVSCTLKYIRRCLALAYFFACLHSDRLAFSVACIFRPVSHVIHRVFNFLEYLPALDLLISFRISA